MSKKVATPKMMQKTPSWFGQFVSQHRKLTVVMFVGLIIVLAIGLVRYNTHQNKFSSKDYAAIEVAAEAILTKLGGAEIKKEKQCHYAAPEKYASVGLFCGIELATYIPYQSDQQAINIAETLEKEADKLGGTISHMDELYKDPHNAYTGLSVNLEKPLPKTQCHFSIATGERAGLVAFVRLEDKTGRDLIGISFDCSGESREEYFPVTYRQGE